jgi:hypothetical protein
LTGTFAGVSGHDADAPITVVWRTHGFILN